MSSSELDMRAARERVETVEKRIAALAEAGVDVAALRTQLAFAHGALRDSRLADIEAICDEVMGSARRLAELGGRSPAHPAQTRTPASGTEAFQRVKIQRAQLADEVKSAIDAEVKSQMVGSEALAATQLVEAMARRVSALENRSHAPDLAAQIEQLGCRVNELTAGSNEARLLAERLQSIEARLATAAAPESMDIHGLVTKAIAEALPSQANDLLRAAIEKLPTRDDLHQIAETLRTDLDWRLERTAAEHGWCSLSDVQTTVRKALAEQDPGGGVVASSQLARLETTLSEFVQQSQEQQSRLIAALADRVAYQTKSLTRRMIVRDNAPGERLSPETEELPPSNTSGEASQDSAHLAAITVGPSNPSPSKAPTEVSLDPVPPETLAQVRERLGDTTMLTKRVQAAPATPAAPQGAQEDESEPTLHQMVTAAVEHALGDAPKSSIASTLVPSSALANEGSSSDRLLPAGTNPDGLNALVATEVTRQIAGVVPALTIPNDDDLVRAVIRVLPAALQDEAGTLRVVLHCWHWRRLPNQAPWQS
jgi:hypothetical protein